MIQYSGLIMLVCGVLAKVGATFVTIPGPVIAGVFFIKFSMITAVGLSTLQYIDLSSSRNLFILGFSIFFGLSFPKVNNINDKPGIISYSLYLSFSWYRVKTKGHM